MSFTYIEFLVSVIHAQHWWYSIVWVYQNLFMYLLLNVSWIIFSFFAIMKSITVNIVVHVLVTVCDVCAAGAAAGGLQGAGRRGLWVGRYSDQAEGGHRWVSCILLAASPRCVPAVPAVVPVSPCWEAGHCISWQRKLCAQPSPLWEQRRQERTGGWRRTRVSGTIMQYQACLPAYYFLLLDFSNELLSLDNISFDSTT